MLILFLIGSYLAAIPSEDKRLFIYTLLHLSLQVHSNAINAIAINIEVETKIPAGNLSSENAKLFTFQIVFIFVKIRAIKQN